MVNYARAFSQSEGIIITYKALNGLAPAYIKDVLKP